MYQGEYPHYLSCHPLYSQGLSLTKHSPEMINVSYDQSKSKMCHGNYSVKPVFLNPFDVTTNESEL